MVIKAITKLVHKYKPRSGNYNRNVFIFIVLFGFVGAGILFVSNAASPNSFIEPEDGALTQNATRGTDANASGGAYITFSSPSPSLTKIGTSQYRTGTTFTQDTFNGSNATSLANAQTLLGNSTFYYNTHIMGFGPGNPSLSAGSAYSWSSLDSRINGTMKSSPAIVLTACCSPGWMKGTPDFGTDPNGKLYIEYAPTPDHYGDYADMIAAAASRYPSIKYIQVWNEMKGFWDSAKNRWNYEGYTQLYNLIWTRVKAVRPDIKIGGPYVVIASNGGSHGYNSTVGGTFGMFDSRDLDAIKYWLQNKTGADFITLDGKNTNRDGVVLTDAFSATDVYDTAMQWIRGLDNAVYKGAKTLPVWWAEWYNRTGSTTDSLAYKNALMSVGLIRTVKSGSATALVWGPEGDAQGIYASELVLFNDTTTVTGGQATLFHAAQKIVNDNFSAGTDLYAVTNTNAQVETMASKTKIMLVNRSSSAQTTVVQGSSVSLAGYEVKLIDMPS